jgi:putative ABC transport system ATP-binding protein
MMTDSTQSPVYELRGVSKTYGGGAGAVRAVCEVELTIATGDSVAVVGPSGSGKTTLLQLLGALDRPSAGSLRFEGQDLSCLGDGALSRLRLSTFGFVFQQFNLIPTLTAAQNVEAALAPSRRSGPERTEIVSRLLERVGLANRADHLPSALSGGEQQRVAIARALANEPHVVLADEPTGNLDSATGAAIIELMLRLRRERGSTLLLVTHDPALAAHADRIVSLLDGVLVNGNGHPPAEQPRL